MHKLIIMAFLICGIALRASADRNEVTGNQPEALIKALDELYE